ncbi:hypothetical protein QE152_g22105 [Popillia japonica]|uniref:Uncharacterized protein n=1 Tax=Popillia japonica TaxID=7064 RepID=A0AAW1KJK8_POPJA
MAPLNKPELVTTLRFEARYNGRILTYLGLKLLSNAVFGKIMEKTMVWIPMKVMQQYWWLQTREGFPNDMGGYEIGEDENGKVPSSVQQRESVRLGKREKETYAIRKLRAGN